MAKVKSNSLPAGSLLNRYQENGSFTDCYSHEIPVDVTFAQYVKTFYSSNLFRLERFILKWVVSKPSTDAQLDRLVSGDSSEFAAWTVEDRTQNQLLLTDYRGSTRSWLMIERDSAETHGHTTLYFGSAIVPVTDKYSGERRMGFAFKALLGFHKLYSIALLSAAGAGLVRRFK